MAPATISPPIGGSKLFLVCNYSLLCDVENKSELGFNDQSSTHNCQDDHNKTAIPATVKTLRIFTSSKSYYATL